MKIREILELTKTKPIKDLAKDLPTGEKNVRAILKGLNAEPPKVGHSGWTFENVKTEDLDKDISEFVTRKAYNKTKASNSNSKDAKKETMKSESKRDIIKVVKDESRKENDMKAEIQALIKGSKEEANRIYKGIYFDKDIAHFLDNVVHGNKSEIVNKIMRQFLAENELL